MQFDPLDLGLFAIVLIVLVGPFMVKKIEHNLEVFLFIMGVLAVTISSFYNKEALIATLGYTRTPGGAYRLEQRDNNGGH